MKGHKKVSDYLIDVKWPRILRDEVVLLTRGEEILWVVGMRASHCCRVGATTREILLVELKRNPC
jgi:tRNA(Ile)-lysidine synthase